MRKIFLLFLFVAFFPSRTLNAQTFYEGEILKYKVSFLGLTLGYIDISCLGDTLIEGEKAYYAKAYMRSNPDIPFVELKAIFKSWIDPSAAFSRRFVGSQKLSDGSWDLQIIDFDYKRGRIRNRKWIRKKIWYDSLYQTRRKYSDGLSLFFLARKYLKLNKTVLIPTIMDDDRVNTVISFKNKKEIVRIKSVSYPIKTIYFNGKAEWTGIYGITGYFEGWFSDDDARVPIKAKMKVYVGDIDIELVEWRRAGWTPPKK